MPNKKIPVKANYNALDFLAQDHRDVIRLFEQFRQLRHDKNSSIEQQEIFEDAKEEIMIEACSLLTMHAQMEEEIFYPALRNAIDDPRLIDEAELEHQMVQQLITELEDMGPGDEFYDANFAVLSEYARHHIEVEEKEIFSKARRAKLDLDELGMALDRRKNELIAAAGLEDYEQAQEFVQRDDFDEVNQH